MITYTESEVDLLKSMIPSSPYARGDAFHLVNELRRAFWYGHDHPYIAPNYMGSTDSAYFIQYIPFEELPLHVDKQETRLLLEWRLRIGK